MPATTVFYSICDDDDDDPEVIDCDLDEFELFVDSEAARPASPPPSTPPPGSPAARRAGKRSVCWAHHREYASDASDGDSSPGTPRGATPSTRASTPGSMPVLVEPFVPAAPPWNDMDLLVRCEHGVVHWPPVVQDAERALVAALKAGASSAADLRALADKAAEARRFALAETERFLARPCSDGSQRRLGVP